MIKVHGFGPAFNVVDASPFVVKVIAYLKINKIDHEVVNDSNNLQKAPRGKLPFIEDNGTIIADSYAVIEHIKKQYNADLDHHLDDDQKALAYILARALDEDFYWLLVYSRWYEDDNWPALKFAFFDSMPVPLKWLIPIIARRSVKASLFKQGVSRRDKKELVQLAEKSLHSYSQLLADKAFFFGDKPCSLDVVAYSHFAQLTMTNLDSWLNDIGKQHSNIVEFCQRFDQQFMQ